MPALSLHQPWAQLLVTRQPWREEERLAAGADIDTPAPMVKWIETRSWPCPPKYIGQRIAFHATAHKPNIAPIGDYWTDSNGRLFRRGASLGVPLPRRAVVGSGIVTASLPIVQSHDLCDPAPYDLITVVPNAQRLAIVRQQHPPTDVSDQLRYSDFTPGRYAWIIDDAAPTTEPIPARGHQRIWQWTPHDNERTPIT